MILIDSIKSVAIKALGVGLTFSVSIVLARQLGVAGFGIYSFVFSLATIFAIPVQAGLPVLLVREVAGFLTKDDWKSVRGLWGWSSKFILFSSLLLLPVFFLISNVSENESPQFIYLAGLLLVPAIAYSSLIGAFFRGLGSVVLGQMSGLVFRPFLLLLFLAIFLFINDELSARDALLIHALAGFFPVIFLMKYGSKRWPKMVGHGGETDSAYLLKSLAPLAAISGIQVINQQADIVMLGMIIGKEEVGIYKVAAMASGLIIFGLQAVNMVIAPKIVAAYKLKENRRLQALIGESAGYIFLFAIGSFFLLYFLGEYFLGLLYGERFLEAYLPLLILCSGQLINAMFGSVALVLNMTNNERVTLKGVILAVIANLLLNFMLIPKYGMLGASFATASTLLIWNLFLWLYVRKNMGIETSVFYWVKGLKYER